MPVFVVDFGEPMIIVRKNGKFVIDDNEFENRKDVITYLVDQKQQSEKATSHGLPTTFVELEEAREMREMISHMLDMTDDFTDMAYNIMFDFEDENKGDHIMRLSREFTERLTRKKDSTAGVLTRIYKSLSRIVSPDKKESTNMFIYKDDFGTYRWVARYSNNLLDDDTPQEIISAESHEKFAALVKSGAVPPPELWLWHEKDWKWGEAEWVTTDKQGEITFAVAGGVIYPEFDDLAESLMAQADGIKVSHGMPKWSIKRDANKANVIVEHITREISPLPGWAAANKFTGFVTLRENTDMALSKEEKSRLMTDYDVSAELISRIEGSNQKDADEASDLEIETKDVVADTASGTDKVEEKPDPAPADKADTTSANEVSPQDIITFMADTNKAMLLVGETLQKTLEKIETLRGEITEIKSTEEEQIARKATESPFASLTSMLVRSTIGSPETRVDGRTSIAKSGPAENNGAASGNSQIGIPFIDQLINGSGG